MHNRLNEKKIAECEKILKVTFSNKKYLIEALTHKSFVNETDRSRSDNQRLEFLGDSVLSLIITEYLFRKLDLDDEGILSKLKATLISDTMLHQISTDLGLGNFIQLGRGEELAGGRERKKLLEDLFEAVVGAIYLDAGFEKTREFILNTFETKLKNISIKDNYKDYKTIFQEITQKQFKLTPIYNTSENYDNNISAMEFNSEVSVKNTVYGRGYGKSKKMAEIEAAKNALEKIKNKRIK